MNKHIAYRAAIDAVTEANKRYIQLWQETTRTDAPLAATVEERQKQYQQWSAGKAQRTRALVAAQQTLSDACIARDAAFAALKGN